MDNVDFLELFHRLGLSEGFFGLKPESVKVNFIRISPPKKFGQRVCDMRIDRHTKELEIEVHDTDMISAEKVIVAMMSHSASYTFNYSLYYIKSILVFAVLFFTSAYFSVQPNENGINSPIYGYLLIGMSINLLIQLYIKDKSFDKRLRVILDNTRKNMGETGIFQGEDDILLYSSPFIDRHTGWLGIALPVFISILIISISLTKMSGLA